MSIIGASAVPPTFHRCPVLIPRAARRRYGHIDAGVLSPLHTLAVAVSPETHGLASRRAPYSTSGAPNTYREISSLLRQHSTRGHRREPRLTPRPSPPSPTCGW